MDDEMDVSDICDIGLAAPQDLEPRPQPHVVSVDVVTDNFNVIFHCVKTDATNSSIWQRQKLRGCRITTTYLDVDSLQ
eukprot:9494673-Pyramimonas_sp.AAC.1